MTKLTETVDITQLIDLLVYHTENYVKLTAIASSKADVDACNDMLAKLLKEYELRQQYLSNYN